MGTFAIGDIHGTSGALQTLLNLHLFTDHDQVIFLGDYVNKGEGPKGVIEQLIQVSEEYSSVFLRGNHGIMMLEARKNKQLVPQWLFSGGDNTLDSYDIGDTLDWYLQIPQDHWNFLESSIPFYEINDTIFVHAGLKSGVPLDQQHRLNLFWKSVPEPTPYAPDKQVICGHTSRKNGMIAEFGRTIYIDTFAWGGQQLTCLEV